ncbi:MAG: cardiolipin synthase [bacterium]
MIGEWIQGHVGVTLAITIGGYLITAVYVPRVLLRKSEPGATLAWLIVILLFPYAGLLLYTLLGSSRIQRRRAARRESDERIERELAVLLEPTATESEPCAPEPWMDANLFRVARNLGLGRGTAGNEVILHADGPQAFAAMLTAIQGARHHVHVEFFIFRHDRTGQRVLDALVAAARRGVEVRLLVDAVGLAMTRTRTSFFRPLRDAGGEFVRFLPLGWVRGWSFFNLRNHRKLLVIDGETAFTGGMNVGDEYAGRRRRFTRPWRDTMVRIRGPAARALQAVFARDWYFAIEKNLAEPRYFPDPGSAGNDIVQVVQSGPDDSLLRLHRHTLALIQVARERLYILTPYFIPDLALASALALAALRGVDVRIMLPRRSNHLLVKWAGRSFYEELLETGVVIHEFDEGMLHAKAIVVDGIVTSVGSANMDIRSFRLNFELNTFVYGAAFAAQIEEVFVRNALASRRVDPAEFARRSVWLRFAETTARVLSPVL